MGKKRTLVLQPVPNAFSSPGGVLLIAGGKRGNVLARAVNRSSKASPRRAGPR